MELEPTYHLEGVVRTKETPEDFEGPLTLILMLLSKNKIEIRDIRISEILEQYLAYLDAMKAMDLEVASEFVQMAAHLLYIKTKTLLAGDEEEVGELEQLIASLEQLKARDIYAAVKEITPELLRASEYGSLYDAKEPEPLPGAKEYRNRHEGWELLKALSDMMQRSRTALDEQAQTDALLQRRQLLPKRIIYSVQEKSREILHRLCTAERLSLREFYLSSRSRSEVVATFVSILELCAKGHALLAKEGDEIYVSFAGGSIEEILENIGE